MVQDTRPAPPQTPGPIGSYQDDRSGREGLEAYQRVADTVAGPSLRIKDNVVQAAVVIGCTLVGAGAGFVIGQRRGEPEMGALIGGAGMMILSTLVSGLIIMVLGFVRAAGGRGR